VKVERAETVLAGQIASGHPVVNGAAATRDGLAYTEWERGHHRWTDVTKDALVHIYVGREEAESFEKHATTQPRLVIAATNG
jgi:hypothetical protein